MKYETSATLHIPKLKHDIFFFQFVNFLMNKNIFTFFFLINSFYNFFLDFNPNYLYKTKTEETQPIH